MPAAPAPDNLAFFRRLPKNLAIWTLVCGVSAAPSFVIAVKEFPRPEDVVGMLLGVTTFIVGYAVLSSTDFVAGLKRDRRILITLRIGYVTRMAYSMISIIPVLSIVDMVCGMMAVSMTGLGRNRSAPRTGLETYFTTIIQGVLLNIVLAVFMGIVFALVCAFVRRARPVHLCRVCGYDLRASPARCPECGTPGAPAGHAAE